MKLRWRIAFGTVGAVVLAAAAIAAVPASRAAAGDFFAQVFHMYEYTPMELSYLPDGFESTSGGVTMMSGSATQSGQPDDAVTSEQALYNDGDRFILVNTATNDGSKLPQGEKASVKGKKAVIVTGVSGTADGLPELVDLGTASPPQGAAAAGDQPVDIKGSGSATVVGVGTIVTDVGGGSATGAMGEIGVSSSSSGEGGPSVQYSGPPPETKPFAYTNATSLTWIANGMRMEIISNLPVAEILKIAEGLVPGGSKEVQG